MAWAFKKEANQGTKQAKVHGLGRLITRHCEGERCLRRWMQDRLQEIRDQDRDRLVLWLPVGFAFGAGATCSVRADDPAFVWVTLAFLALFAWLLLSVMAQRSVDLPRALALVAPLRNHAVSAWSQRWPLSTNRPGSRISIDNESAWPMPAYWWMSLPGLMDREHGAK